MMMILDLYTVLPVAKTASHGAVTSQYYKTNPGSNNQRRAVPNRASRAKVGAEVTGAAQSKSDRGCSAGARQKAGSATNDDKSSKVT